MATRSGRRIDIKKKRVKPLDDFVKNKRKVKENKKRSIPEAFIKISVLSKDTQEILEKKSPKPMFRKEVHFLAGNLKLEGILSYTKGIERADGIKCLLT